MAKKRIFAAFDVDHHENAKIEVLSDAAYRSWHRLISWCVRSTSSNPEGRWIDGLMPGTVFAARTTSRTANELLAGLVDEEGDDFRLHDYCDQQRSAADVIKMREARRSAGSKGGSTKAANAKANAEQPATKPVAVQEQEQGQDQETTSSQSGNRPVPLRATPAPEHTPISPPDARCTAHRGVADPGPCNGCRRERERLERLAAAEAERLAREIEEAARLCPDCDGVRVVDADGNPTRTVCGHPKTRRTA